MSGTRKLQTQTEVFWRDEYGVSEADLDLTAGVILEAGKPQRLSALAAAVIMRRFQREREAIARQAKSGLVYQPEGRYDVGQQLVFSALEFAVGRVVATRPGRNPRHGPFGVIRVALEDGSPEREFAAEFAHPHPLNRPAEELLGGTDAGIGEAELVRLYEHYVARQLDAALKANPDYVPFGGQWFLRELLPEIHVGYCNLAEAMVYEARHPLAAQDMLTDLDLAGKGSVEQQLFALNYALGKDDRFDNVSRTENPVWYLRALEPAAVFSRPAVLKPAFRAVGGAYLGLTLLDLVEEVGDELDDIETVALPEAQGVQFEVTFPHLYAGTMPARLRYLRQLPYTPHGHLPLTMVDSRTGQRFEAWALPEERYICGLGDWYTAVEMCVGGQVSLAPTGEPLTFALAATPAKTKRSEWVRAASVVDNRLALQMQRATIAVRCDRSMLVDVPDREAIARLMASTEGAQISLSALVHNAFEEQAKLSSKGVVHVKSLYSTVNLLRRVGTVPVFAEMTRRACYDPVGDGFWAHDPSLEGATYSTPEEMRERPRSSRQDLVKDQVVQYLGR